MLEERYEIIKLLGKGRTGGVYEAEDTVLGRKVALRRFFAQTKKTDLAEYKADFEKVAHTLSALQHPNLLRVYDAGLDSDGAYIISQLLKGDTLHERINDGPISTWEVYDLAQQMLDALSTAHSEGFVHGAITPGSILMSPRARGGYLYVILDMGLSRLAPLIQGKDSILSIMADPAILAPELFDGGVANERADLYMLGHILYMCLAGGHPFGGVSAVEAEKMHQAGLPPLQDYNAEVPEDFRLWIEKLIQFNPDDRPSSAIEALSILPKVPRHPKRNSTVAHTVTPQLKSGTTFQPQSSTGANPRLDPRLTTGVIATSPNTVTAGVGVLSLPPAKKDPKKLMVIGLGVLFVVIAISITVILYNKNAAKMQAKLNETTPNTPEEVADFTPKKTIPPASKKDPKPIEKIAPKPNPKINEPQKGIIVHFDGTQPLANQKGWDYMGASRHALTERKDGWRIKHLLSNDKGFSGLAFPITSGENAMFDFGWKLTYVMRPIEGSHRFGFNFDEKTNPGWEGNKISLLLHVKNNGNGKIVLSSLDKAFNAKPGKSTSFPYNGATGWHTIVVEQKAKSKSGVFSVSIDGKHAFEDKFTKGIEYSNRNHFFSSLVNGSLPGDWVIKEIKLETL